MAGFRIGRGRDNRTPQQQPQRQQQGQYPPQQQPYGRQAPPPNYGGGQQAAPPYGQQQWPPAGGQQGGQQGGQGGYGRQGEPEYLGDPYGQTQAGPYGGRAAQGSDPYANSAGHTQAFSIHDDQYHDAGNGDGGGHGGGHGGGYQATGPSGPKLHWKELLTGVVMRPGPTFFQMRDYPVWGPAVVVTFLYGLLALFGFDTAREDAINSTLSTAIPYALSTAVAFVIGGLLLGVVTHTLARQLGGDGAWQPTVGLSMLIMSITDAPRLLFALFLGGDNSLVQILGWLTWIGAGALFTVMVSKSHDLPWPKALAASAIQLIALLSLLKLGTL
ncbi:Yip1 family protein [Streptomyces sp. NPDC093109]|uniref:Yip1 family protein n=1 Tax=Streptomyces sp. NPDC093109 TaxID=3154977 RepID=UPI00344C4ADC